MLLVYNLGILKHFDTQRLGILQESCEYEVILSLKIIHEDLTEFKIFILSNVFWINDRKYILKIYKII